MIRTYCAVSLAAALVACGSTPPAGGSGGASGTGGRRPGTGGAPGAGGMVTVPPAGTGGTVTPGTGGGVSAPDAAVDGLSPPAPDAPPAEALPPPATGEHDCTAYFGTGPRSAWAEPASAGSLKYKPLNPGGDRIMDFSYAGYRNGGVPLPRVAGVVKLMPSGGDDTAAIQGAIDLVAARPLEGGFRGAVELAAGTYKLGGVIRITASGVVLRGAGPQTGGTEIRMEGASRRVVFVEGVGAMRSEDPATVATIVDDNVPAGARTFSVDKPGNFKVGDPVLVGRPVTEAWIALVGMDKLVRNGEMQTWLRAGTVIRAERVVTAIEGSKVTVDIPIADSFDGKYVKPPGGTIAKYSFPGRINQVGIEGFRIVGRPRSEVDNFHFVRLTGVEDAWIKDVVAQDVTSGAVIDASVRRVTIDNLQVVHTPVEYFTAAAPSDFNIDGTEILIVRSGSKGGNKIFYHSTASQVPGPNVILHFTGSGMRSHLQPHQRWATGLLTDNTTLDDGNIEYINRGTAGSGHGWTMGWGVVWNSSASSINVSQPPGTANWAIGNRGTQRGDGTFDAHGTPVAPTSLYLAQLCARLGPAAVAALGY